jgi:hypothetical protein
VGRKQGASANACDDIELGTVAPLPPALQKASAERTVLTATGEHQDLKCMTTSVLEEGDDALLEARPGYRLTDNELVRIQWIMAIRQRRIAQRLSGQGPLRRTGAAGDEECPHDCE